ncbi:MAG: undecaprenyl-diphosphate phosphatase [Bacteroidales bacterium]|nr:undecaprenyl-diphosphate phosphatase [Bacteroidales bacterium]
MEWWQAIILGTVQGLSEFLPVSSSGHLMIFKEILGADAEGFLDFTVTVHFATVLSTLIVFWAAIRKLLTGLLKFKYNDETDYIVKLLVSAIPVAIVGFAFKDQVEALFGENLTYVAYGLIATAVLLWFSDVAGKVIKARAGEKARNGITWWQALVVGIGQALAVAPGVSRSGTTIATGLIIGVRRDVMAQFSFLMVLLPIIGEQGLAILKAATGHGEAAGSVGFASLVLGFIFAFVSGLFACKAMVALVRRARLGWFSLYCLAVAILILVLT